MMNQTVEDFLKERLLIDDNLNVDTKFDELVSTVKMLMKIKCKEQRYNCAIDLEFVFRENEATITGVNPDSILDAKEPTL